MTNGFNFDNMRLQMTTIITVFCNLYIFLGNLMKNTLNLTKSLLRLENNTEKSFKITIS